MCAAGVITWTFEWPAPLHAQSYESTQFSRLDSNAVFTATAPLNATAKCTSFAWGFVYAAGFNFNNRHSALGEIMWNSLSPTSEAIAPLRTALQNNNITGKGNLVALTANYRWQFEGKVWGTYFIADGGLYYRDAKLSQYVTVGNSISCNPAWLGWGFTCSSGTVTRNRLSVAPAPRYLAGMQAWISPLGRQILAINFMSKPAITCTEQIHRYTSNTAHLRSRF